MIFNIKLSPVANLSTGWEPLSLEIDGASLIINNETFDLSVLPEGSTLPDAAEATGCKYFADDIERDDNGDFHLTLMLPHEDNAPEEARFPSPLVITQDGVVELPNVFEPKEIEDDN